MFTYKLEHPDGTPAEPPTIKSITPTWAARDVIYLGRRTLRVIDVRNADPPVLVVES